MIIITSWMQNRVTSLCNVVSALLRATEEALAERLQSVRETVSLLYNTMKQNIEYGLERLKSIVKIEAEETKEHHHDDDEQSLLNCAPNPSLVCALRACAS